jgi:hypothetical protein
LISNGYPNPELKFQKISRREILTRVISGVPHSPFAFCKFEDAMTKKSSGFSDFYMKGVFKV